MISELSSALDNYYRIPSYMSRKPKNLVLTPIGKSNKNLQDIYGKENYPLNLFILNNYLPNAQYFSQTPNFNYNNKILTPISQNKSIINSLNNPNYVSTIDNEKSYTKNNNIRAKSAMRLGKGRIIKSSDNIKYSYNRNSNHINNIDNYDEMNNNMKQFEGIVNSINTNGFQKFKEEIDNKKLMVKELKNSISIIKNKICKCQSYLYNGLHKESKKKILYENMLSVSKKYKNMIKSTVKYKKDIDNIKDIIYKLNEETIKLKSIALNEQNDLDIIKEEIKKGNKAISDKQKEIENILPAIQLLKNHIESAKQKIFKYNNIQSRYLDELNYIESKI